MNPKTVKDAIIEAERFIARAKALLAVEIIDQDYRTGNVRARKWTYTHEAPKQMGACRRASMDLTRALAEMRKP